MNQQALYSGNRIEVESLKLLQLGLAGLYFVYAAYIAYLIVGGFQTAMQTNTYVPGLLLFSFIFAGSAAFCGALGVLELRGHHHQNIAGSILSMMFLAAAALLQDSHIGVSEGEALLVVFVTAMLGLIDLRALPERRTFSAVLSLDAFLLISYSLIAAYPKSFSGPAAIITDAGILGGVFMLGFGLFRLVKPPRPLGVQV
jgi:hypothetical protein